MYLSPRRWLLLRGLAREARHWGDFPKLLASRGLDTVCLDLAGVGTERHRPCPASVSGLVEDLRARFDPGAGPWGIFAQSLGGMIALDWAGRYPGDFARVVVANTSTSDLSPPHRRITRFGVWSLLRAAFARDPATRERVALELVANSERGRARAAEWASWVPVSAGVFLAQLLASARARAPRCLPVPLDVLASEGDRMVSVTCSRAIADRFGAPLHVHPSAGHDLSLDDPAWVAERLAGAPCVRTGVKAGGSLNHGLRVR